MVKHRSIYSETLVALTKPSASWTERERTLVERYRRDMSERAKSKGRAYFARCAAERDELRGGGDADAE